MQTETRRAARPSFCWLVFTLKLSSRAYETLTRVVLVLGAALALGLPSVSFAEDCRGESEEFNWFEWSGKLDDFAAKLDSSITAERTQAARCLVHFPARLATPLLLEALKDEVEWVFMGMYPERSRACVAEVHPPVGIDKYPAKLASLNLDLAIAPLEINAFNEAKSNLRLLEYGILGWPVVCTDISPYRSHDTPVTRVPNEPEAWIAAIRQKLADPVVAAQEGQRLKQWVVDNFILEDHLDEWVRALLD